MILISKPNFKDIVTSLPFTIYFSSTYPYGFDGAKPNHQDAISTLNNLKSATSWNAIIGNGNILPPFWNAYGGLNNQPFIDIDARNYRALFIPEGQWTQMPAPVTYTIGIVGSNFDGNGRVISREVGTNGFGNQMYTGATTLGAIIDTGNDTTMNNYNGAPYVPRKIIAGIWEFNWGGTDNYIDVFGHKASGPSSRSAATSQGYGYYGGFTFGFRDRAGQTTPLTMNIVNLSSAGRYSLYEFFFFKNDRLAPDQKNAILKFWKFKYNL